jgi:SsrA-binding protein
MAKQDGESGRIAVNRRARHDYFIEEQLEAGVALQGWEVKALRAGRLQLAEAYVLLKDGEAWLFGAHVSPLVAASTQTQADPTRDAQAPAAPAPDRLARRRRRAQGSDDRAARDVLKDGRAKLEIGLARGKKEHDKRADTRDRDWARERARVLKARR